MIATMMPSAIPLGASVPALTSHAISVSLPTWADNVAYEEGDKRVVNAMQTGYPRFFIHRSIQKLAGLCLAKFGRPDEQCILLPSPKSAIEARDFLANQSPSLPSRIVEFVICPSISSLPTAPATPDMSSSSKTPTIEAIELQILLFDKEHFPTAKMFWQHTGDGICSRMADRALAFLGETPAGVEARSTDQSEIAFSKTPAYSRNRHYSRRSVVIPAAPGLTSPKQPSVPAAKTLETPSETVEDELLTLDLTTFLEERYGRNLPLFNAPLAKQALKRRIAGGLLPSDEDYGKVDDVARGGGSGRAVTEEDVYLYPGGMSAIWHAHDTCRKARRGKGEKEGKSICYGFPYTDTFKILSKWGEGCQFFGRGGTEDIESLSNYLANLDPSEPRTLSLFCEFPGNPLLRTPDLVRLRELADHYGFVLVVDETIGNFINVEVATYCDIVVSSLSKIFSGDANVMGGSLVLNPNTSHYETLKSVLASDYEDTYYPEDAVYMERNSRDYRNRIKRVNDNAYDVCEYLHSRSLADQSTPNNGKVIKSVFYPRYMDTEQYSQARRLPSLGKGGYGGLFSVTFTSMEASRAFFDRLGCAKGPSLGTSFTLACPYTILAHYYELDWAASYGVDEGLVRVSVGQEEGGLIMKWMEESVRAAEEAGRGVVSA